MTECLFCHIVNSVVPAAIVASTEHTLAFLDVRPVFKGHVLVIPRMHVDTLVDLPPDLIPPVMAQAQRVAACLVTSLGAQGSFVAINNTVSQSVPHLHVHVVPRTKGDGLRGFFWPRQKYSSGEMEQYADRLSAAMGQSQSADHLD